MSYDRATLQQLAELRLTEAGALLNSGMPSGAYYLAGYAVECALKAILAKRFQADAIPDRVLVNSIYRHDIAELISLAGLKQEHAERMEISSGFRRSWNEVKAWNTDSRYKIWKQDEAAAMLTAVSGEEGLMRWLQSRW